MRFVTGGAYNGKKTWVKETFPERFESHFAWINCYETKNADLADVTSVNASTIVIEGVEEGLKEGILSKSVNGEAFFQAYLAPLLEWEKEHEKRKVIMIGTDITKGIVPLDKELREWRDETGRLYQKLFRKADHVHLIWFGIAETL
ncbi:bifunctional adenosylcobinamide kinase/adenosylcobinamide-phosphate guanylyltransferase [Bacillus piscicola]|uniref:bifunctional adenosylcobinamide kinase/adenosylcobinamide-phosphate guanylyltransferase n=1 Tax=Bacillus piscicola TaxID=1632684 RepID=UPI001F09F43C|nr:bifunctional adenosylcobinamide kinase/adenosylcobinamide-phosphate guanylyltransferase [Bacillus piscicola]